MKVNLEKNTNSQISLSHGENQKEKETVLNLESMSALEQCLKETVV